jgi:AraC-like DNA-binding protein
METRQILELLSNLTYVPVTYIKNDQEILHFPDVKYLKNMSVLIPDKILKSKKQADCMLTEELLCFGIVRAEPADSYYIFGPVSAIPCDYKLAQRILKRYNLPATQMPDLLSYFSNTLNFSLPKFANLIIFANYVLNNETIDILDLLPEEYNMDDDQVPITSKQKIVPDIEHSHRGISYEKQLFSLVKYGKHQELSDFFNTSKFAGNEGVLADDLIRHQKNLVICSTTMASRAAVEGGLDYETAMRNADAFMQKVEMAPDMKHLAVLNHNMLMTYARLVALRKVGNQNSAIAMKVYNYVEQHLNSRMKIEEIATSLGLSRSYLSLQFKKETGMNLYDFINKAKIDEAKMLLTTTKMTSINIASILDFSSQSYFQAIFKKYAGMTPKKYRTTNFI